MTTMIRRAIASTAISIAAVGTLATVGATPAEAAPETTETEFILDVFPHETTAVYFWDSWGAARSGGRSHQGTDIMSPKGTSVLAVADGVVDELGWNRLSGYFIRLDHGNGYMTTYMHLNNDTLGTDDGLGGPWTAYHATLHEGKEVVAGDVIGYVGDSGNAEGTKPHTHFEIKYDGVKQNPFPWVEDIWVRTQNGHAIPLSSPR